MVSPALRTIKLAVSVSGHFDVSVFLCVYIHSLTAGPVPIPLPNRVLTHRLIYCHQAELESSVCAFSLAKEPSEAGELSEFGRVGSSI